MTMKTKRKILEGETGKTSIFSLAPFIFFQYILKGIINDSILKMLFYVENVTY